MLKRALIGLTAALAGAAVFGLTPQTSRADDFDLYVGTPGFALRVGHGHHWRHHYPHHRHHLGHHGYLPWHHYYRPHFGHGYYWGYPRHSVYHHGYWGPYVLPHYGGFGLGVGIYGGGFIIHH